MPGGLGKGHDQAMIFYFDQLLRDCKGPFRIERRSLEKWAPFGMNIADPDMARILIIAFFIFLILFFASLSWGTYSPSVALLILVGVITYSIWDLGGEKMEVGYRTRPGFIKMYQITTTSAVESVYQALSFGKVPFNVFGVTLTDWPDKPRATIFATERSNLLITVFKDKADPTLTVVHIGAYSKKKRRAVRTLKRVLDGHLPYPS